MANATPVTSTIITCAVLADLIVTVPPPIKASSVRPISITQADGSRRPSLVQPPDVVMTRRWRGRRRRDPQQDEHADRAPRRRSRDSLVGVTNPPRSNYLFHDAVASLGCWHRRDGPNQDFDVQLRQSPHPTLCWCRAKPRAGSATTAHGPNCYSRCSMRHNASQWPMASPSSDSLQQTLAAASRTGHRKPVGHDRSA